MSDDILAKFENEADQLTERADRDEAAIKSDANLSDEGKRARLAAVGAEYARATDVLQYRASEMVRVELEDAQEELTKHTATAAKKEREMLGPGIAFELERLTVEDTAPADLPALVESARDEWERSVRYALASRKMRAHVAANRGNDQVTALAGNLAMLAPAPDAKVKELENRIVGLKDSDWRIQNLNRRAFNARIRELIR